MLDSDIKTYLSAEVSAAQTNGGRCGNTEVISGVVNNVWPQVPKAQRVAGAYLYRKTSICAADDADGTLMSGLHMIDRPTLADDMIVAFVGTPTDTLANITGSATGADTQPKFGSAYIKNAITGGTGSRTITVTVEDAKFASGAEAIFLAAKKIKLLNTPTPDSATGTSEDHVISTIDSVSGLDVTFSTTVDITNDYLVDGDSRCISIVDFGDIKTSTDNYTVTTAGDGDYDDSTYPIVCDNIGTIEDGLTIEFTDSTHFTVTGSSGKNYGSGDTSTDFEPTNPDRDNKPYFKIPFSGFILTWAAADTLTVNIHEAKKAIWYRREVPAGCASLANNKMTAVVEGESDT